MRRQIYILLLIALCYSCKDESKSKVREIYYRGISGLGAKRISGTDTVYFRTEVLAFYSDTLGIKIIDERDSSKIDEIISRLPLEYQEPEVFSNNITGTKLSRKFFDSNNAIISEKVLGSTSHETLLKTYYEPSVESLFTRKYQVDCHDTVYLTDLDNNWVNIYSAIQSHSIASNLNYPKKSIKSCLVTPLAPKKEISYNTLLQEFVTFTTSPIDTTGSHQFDDNKFAIVFRTIGQIGQASYAHHVAVIDDSIFCRFDVKYKDSINHKTSRLLKIDEKKIIQKLFNAANLDAKQPFSLSLPTKSYQALPVLIVVRNKGRNFAGGFLNPFSYPSCLLKTKSLDQAYKDCRSISSTMTGDFDDLYKYLESKYIQLDSLQKIIGIK
jgi:hypothetical protein